jgi:hypothetical protein
VGGLLQRESVDPWLNLMTPEQATAQFKQFGVEAGLQPGRAAAAILLTDTSQTPFIIMVEGMEIDGDRTTVQIRYEFVDATVQRGTWTLEKLGGRWLVDGLAAAATPVATP